MTIGRLGFRQKQRRFIHGEADEVTSLYVLVNVFFTRQVAICRLPQGVQDRKLAGLDSIRGKLSYPDQRACSIASQKLIGKPQFFRSSSSLQCSVLGEARITLRYLCDFSPATAGPRSLLPSHQR